MMTQTETHSTASGRLCFKCRQDMGSSVMRYLGHDWCRTCAKSEAELRLQRLRSRSTETTNGTKAENVTIPGLPGTMQALIEMLPVTGHRNFQSALTTAAAVAGSVLLAIGLGMALAMPAAFTGPTLALSGAILIGAVVQKR